MAADIGYGTIIAISVVAAVTVTVGADMTRPRGARMFNRGKNKEKGLLFDGATAPGMAAGAPNTPQAAG